MRVKVGLIIISLLFSPALFAENTIKVTLQNALEKARVKNDVSAMQMTVILPDQEYITVAAGDTRKKNGFSVQRDTLFQIGSDTKSFTAALILKLEAEGKLKLSNTLGHYFSQYPQWKSITLEQILHNTSGIFSYTEDEDFQQQIEKHPNKQWKPEELVAIAAKHANNFAPGKGWHYSNTNFILAGMVAEKVTEKPLDQLFNEAFFNKKALNLSDTYYLPTAYPAAILERMAHGYDEEGKDITTDNMSWAGAAGAIVSTSTDLARWAYALFHGKAIPELQLEKMKQLVSITTGLPAGKNSKEGYAMGIGMRTVKQYGKWWGHEGETLGFHSLFIWFPESDVTIAIIANGPAPELRSFAVTIPGIIKK